MQRVAEEHLDQILTAVDGSVVKTLSTIAQAAYLKTKQGDSGSAWRLHTHFDIDRSVPTKIDVTSGRNGGKTDEKNVLRSRLEPDHCYVLDRWYAQFTLFNEIHALGSSYVCRIRDNSRYDVLEERPLSEAARAAGVIQDAIVTLGVTGIKATTRPNHPIRLVLAQCTPLRKTGGRDGPPSDGVLRIATNLLDVSAEIIADLYRHLWTVELFFKWIKRHLRTKSFCGTSQNAVKAQIWIAVSVYLLVAIAKQRLGIELPLYTILQILSVSIFEKTPLGELFSQTNYKILQPHPPNQLSLFD